jgi:hypothetical protein
MGTHLHNTSFNRSASMTASSDCGSPYVASGLGRIRISGALRAFLQDARGVAIYPTDS